MPCDLIGSVPFTCRDGVGGISEIKVKIWPGLTSIAANFSNSSGTVTIGAGGASRTSWYTYSLTKETALVTETTTPNIQNGTVFYEQDLKIIFNKISAQLRNEMQMLAQNRLIFAVKDLNGTCFLIGMDYGADIANSTTTTGTARGDRSGYELNFKAKEKAPMYFISSATYDLLITA